MVILLYLIAFHSVFFLFDISLGVGVQEGHIGVHLGSLMVKLGTKISFVSKWFHIGSKRSI